jgi:hypothetical protein
MSEKSKGGDEYLIIDTNAGETKEVWINLVGTGNLTATANNYTSSASANVLINTALKKNDYPTARSIITAWGPSREQRDAMIGYYEQGSRTFPPPYDVFIQPGSDVDMVIAEYKAKNGKEDRTDTKRNGALGLVLAGLFTLLAAAIETDLDPKNLQTIFMGLFGLVMLVLLFLIATMT